MRLDVIAGRFALCDPIAGGSNGTVWRAWDLRPRRFCAAKVLRQRDSGDLIRFTREQAVRLAHRHVLTPYSWVAQDQHVLIARDLIGGGSASTLIGDRGPLAPPTVAMYGEPLSTRFGRLSTGYGLSQSRLAAVIGLSPPMLSPPMLSQLMSGQREISNPAVLGRVVRLEELLARALASTDPAAVSALLDEVAGSRPTLSTAQVRPSRTTQRAAHALAEAVDAKTLRSAATRLGPGPPAEILIVAAELAAAAEQALVATVSPTAAGPGT